MSSEGDRTGEVLDGRYALGELIGVGGMGEVYRAIQLSLARKVAIKLPRRALLDSDGVRERFQIEARAGARITHRNIVRVLELGECDGSPYLVLEHVDGEPLRRMLAREGRLGLDEALGIVIQLAAALGEAHACAVVHGDVKCDNVLVERDRDGGLVPRLIDFGLARIGDAREVRRELVSGTPEYLAPELIRGDPTTRASDIYALGILLYELLVGVPPHAGGSAREIMERHLAGRYRPITDVRMVLPDALDRVLARALATEPAQRYPTAALFIQALENVSAPPRRRLARGSDARSRIDVLTVAAAEARAGSNPDEVVVSYLELAHALIDRREHERAISELERGVIVLGTSRAPIWRLHLLLAAMYDQRGERTRARGATQLAITQARRIGSKPGLAQARALMARFGVRR